MKKLLNFLRNISVSWKFVSVYLSILILHIILVGIYLYFQTSNSAINQAQLVMEQNILQVRESVLQKQDSIINASAILSFDKNIQAFLDREYKDEKGQLEDYQFYISPIAGHILKQNSTINSIRIFMSHNIITEKRNSFYSINNYNDPILYTTVLKSKSTKDGWTSIHTEVGSPIKTDIIALEKGLTFTRRVVSTSTFRETGRIDIEVKESEIFSMLRDPIVNGFGKVLVVDNNNSNIISNNIPDLFQKDIATIGFDKFIKNTKINEVEKINNVKSIVISLPLNEIGCSLVGIFPVSNFNYEVKESFENIIIILTVSSILLGIVIYFVTAALLRRIKKLVKAMKQVREGNLNVSVEVKSKDEFGELGVSFNHMTSRIHDLVETVYKIQLMEREAELKALEAHINPHFLYNTLATISWAARKVKSTEIEKISNSLAKFYRLVLSKGGTVINVKEEVDMVKAYLYIQKIRFEEKFDVVYDIDEEVYEHKTIKNILQPLVENALSHGIEPKRSHGTIIIKGKKLEEGICFKITDDGVGMSVDMLNNILIGSVEESSGSGYALKNIMQRLKGYYGENFTFEIYSRLGIGTEITIILGDIWEVDLC
jgi:two-component system sensor histidine kinase YesM